MPLTKIYTELNRWEFKFSPFEKKLKELISMTFDNRTDTYKEITRQQNSWKVALESLEKKRNSLRMLLEKYRKYTWIFSGCGTSYYLSQTGSFLFEHITGIKTKAVPASDILMFPENVFNSSEKNILIPISRSGTTTEIVKAAQLTRTRFNIPTLAVSCDPESTMIKESDLSLTFPFEKEDSVIMTGSFTTMLMSIMCIASLVNEEYVAIPDLKKLADLSAGIVDEYESTLKSISFDNSLTDFVFLGQGPFYGIANEAALKMQEMSISNSQSFHALEYRHGPMSTANEHTLITILCSETGEAYERVLISDLKKLGARILVFRSKAKNIEPKLADFLITNVNSFGDLLNPIIYTPLLQLLGYYRALAKNINPDNPKNLSAVVKLKM